MKIGVISDVHGNIDALSVVLSELDKQGVNKIICLGDLIGGAGKSEEVIQKILQIKEKCICVRGNREKYIIEGMPTVVHDEKVKVSEEQLDRNDWIKDHLSDISIEFIKSLPTENVIELFGKKIYMVHYPIDSEMNFKRHIKIASLHDNEMMFEEVDADIYLYGHTHAEIYNKNFSKYYINPGALGCPWKTDEAPYGILEVDEKGVTYKQLRVRYNVKKVIEDIEKLAFPGYRSVLKIFYGVE